MMLWSCHSGKGGAQVTKRRDALPSNLANLWRAIYPHAAYRGIWAPKEATRPEWLHFDPKTGKLRDMRFWKLPRSKVYRAHVPATPSPPEKLVSPADSLRHGKTLRSIV